MFLAKDSKSVQAPSDVHISIVILSGSCVIKLVDEVKPSPNMSRAQRLWDKMT